MTVWKVTSKFDFLEFFQNWQDSWNSHDLMRIMAHYREVVVVISAKAAVLLGAWEPPSKTALLDYSTKTIAH